MNKLLITIGGIINLIGVIFHLSLYKILNWSESLNSLSNLNHGVMLILNNHVALTVFIFSYISFFCYKDLVSTKLGKAMMFFISFFYIARGIEDFIMYDKQNLLYSSGLFIFCLITALLYLIPLIRITKK